MTTEATAPGSASVRSACPLPMTPLLHARPWGGRRLAGRAAPPPDGPIGESWEVADLPPDVERGRSAVASGPCAGATLHDLLARDPAWLLGDAPPSPEGGFPLLVKFLDAQQNLSVQVHPTERAAARTPGARVKHESWLVLEAAPDAVLYCGFERPVDATEVRRRAEDGTLPEILRAFPAEPGHCLHLRSGTCHALGAGVLVAEVQTPSDTTFRLFDWGRAGRELHLDAALDCMSFSDAPPPPTAGELVETGAFRTRRLGGAAAFDLELIEWKDAADLEVGTDGRPEVLMNLGAAGRVAADEASTAWEHERTVVIPAAAATWRATLPAGGRMLRVRTTTGEAERLA